MRRLARWDAASLCIIALICALMVARRDIFPIFQDIYYHLAMAESFSQAGGVTTTDFLHYAPFGRPNLYPPLYHVLLLIPLRAGVSPATVGAWASAATYPVVIVTLWYTARTWVGEKASFFTLALFSSSWSVFYGTGYLSSSMLSLALMLWAYHFAVRKRYAAVACCIALSLYCHLTLPHLLVIPLLVLALTSPDQRRRLLCAVGAAYALYSPWAIHVLANGDAFHMLSLVQGYSVNLVLCATAVAGAVLLLSNRGWRHNPSVLVISAPLVLLPIFPGYAFRYLFHAAAFFAVLGGALLGRIWSWEMNVPWHAILARAFVLVLIITMAGQTPVVRASYPDDLNIADYTLELLDSTYLVLVSPENLQYWSLEQYGDNADMAVIVSGIGELMGPRDVLLVPAGSGFEASYITAMTGRATTNGMFKEVSAADITASALPPVRAFLAAGNVTSAPEGATVVPTELFSLVVLDNAETAATSTVPGAALPWWAAALFIFMALGVIVADSRAVLGPINKYIRNTVKTDT